VAKKPKSEKGPYKHRGKGDAINFSWRLVHLRKGGNTIERERNLSWRGREKSHVRRRNKKGGASFNQTITLKGSKKSSTSWYYEAIREKDRKSGEGRKNMRLSLKG